MAAIYAQKFTAPAMMPVDGRAIHVNDRASITAAPSANDTIEFKIPAGLELTALAFHLTDMDTNGSPALAFSVGLKALSASSSFVANDTYFAAAGQTQGRTGGTLRCDFPYVKFEEDMVAYLKVGTAAATFAAGTVSMVASGSAIGVK